MDVTELPVKQSKRSAFVLAPKQNGCSRSCVQSRGSVSRTKWGRMTEEFLPRGKNWLPDQV